MSRPASCVRPAGNKKKALYEVKNVIYTNNSQNHYSRRFLFDWVKQVLETDLKGFADFASGAMYCQLLDAIFPGSVRVSDVLFQADSSSAFIWNFKILDEAFSMLGIKKSIQQQKLAPESYSEHLHFLQWLRKLYEENDKPNKPYMAKKMRGGKVFKMASDAKTNVPKDSKAVRLTSSLSQLGTKSTGDLESERVTHELDQGDTIEAPKQNAIAKKSKSVGVINKKCTTVGAKKQQRVVKGKR